MSKVLNKDYILLAPVVISATVAASSIMAGAVNAETQTSTKVDSNVNKSDIVRSINSEILTNDLQLNPNAVSQNVTSVSQISDVRPTDWAFT
ncbi:MAG TPA: hypothetical protein DCZ88_09920, partial [Pseudanabaena sp.]|nr:hypothetical protein [Pseudanabaena sp.]